ncbi:MULTISPECIES: glycosyltransferase family 2 protein [Paenibacillus]|uniref:glycosyltransferase family 2 protein n=1 Tax=Paenibacillus TaxID=44249 RepID=UPI000491FDEA|nr:MULTISPECIES: glycosyltransferase family 2 protein [Paenibacillus]
MNDISVCIITRNEEHSIEKAICSINPFVREIILVDHYSDDKTAQIARELGAKVFLRKWDNHFAEARNFSIMQATAPVILIMDADEEFVGDNQALEEAAKKVIVSQEVAARIEIQSLTANGQLSVSWITRMFPNNVDFIFKGRIHEQLYYRGGSPKVVNSSIRFYHKGYTQEEINKKNKYQRNISLLLLEHKEDPNNPYLLFQLGRTYGHMNEWIKSKKWFERALDLIKAPYPNYHSTLLLDYANILMKLKEWDKLSNVINTAIEFYPDYTDLYYIYGCAVIEARNPEWFPQIPDVFATCIEIGEVSKGKYESVQGVGSYRSHYNLGLYFELSGDIQLAEYHYRISFEQGFGLALERLNLLNQVK